MMRVCKPLCMQGLQDLLQEAKQPRRKGGRPRNTDTKTGDKSPYSDVKSPTSKGKLDYVKVMNWHLAQYFWVQTNQT